MVRSGRLLLLFNVPNGFLSIDHIGHIDRAKEVSSKSFLDSDPICRSNRFSLDIYDCTLPSPVHMLG